MKKKILLVLPNLQKGGAEKVMMLIFNQLPSIKYDKYLIVLNNKIKKNILYIDPNIRLINLKKKNLKSSIFALFRILRTIKFNYILSTFFHINFVLIFLKPFYNAKLIIRESNDPFFNIQKNKYQFLIKLFYKFFYDKADVILSSSKSMKKKLVNLGSDACKIKVIYNPVDYEYYKKLLKKKNTQNYILFVGRLTYQKAVDDIIKFFNKSKLKELKIVGSGEDLKNLKKLSLSSEKKITFYSKRNPDLFILNARALVLSSRWEGLPNVVLESIALNTPVVSLTNIESLKEILKYKKIKFLLNMISKKHDEVYLLNKILEKKINNKKKYLPDIFHLKNVINNFVKILHE